MRIYVTVNLLRNQSERGFFFHPLPFPSPNVEDLTVAELNAIKKHPTCLGSSHGSALDVFLLFLFFCRFFFFLLSEPI